MLSLPNVTIVCVDTAGNPTQYKESLAALERSTYKIEFGRVMFFTDMTPVQSLSPIHWVKMQPLRYRGYSQFVIKELSQYIETEFVLIVQWDGYVIHPEKFDTAWFAFDYIGAPWDFDDGYDVGNGGFSLRSKRLLEVLRNDPFISVFHPEDHMICRKYRWYLEDKYGIKFADRESAKIFSFEPTKKRTVFEDNTFGFHGGRVYYVS